MAQSNIWHGDSVDLAQYFTDGTIRTMLTDPPFGVNNQSNRAVTEHGKAMARKIANDETPEIAMDIFTRVTHAFMPKMMQDSDIYVFTSYQVLKEWLYFLENLFTPYGYKQKAIIIWKKNRPGMGDTDCSWGMGCEFIIYYKRGTWEQPGKRRNNVIEVPALEPDDRGRPVRGVGLTRACSSRHQSIWHQHRAQ